MVQLTEVVDEEFFKSQAGPEDDDDFTDTDSEISTESDFDYDVSGETLSERIYALRDIIPPTTRGWIHGKWMGATNILRTTAAFLGATAWHVSVTAILFGVPFSVLWAEEQGMIAMEQEQRMRDQGSELLTGDDINNVAGDGNTAGQLEAMLGGAGAGVGSVSAKPSL